MNALLLRLLRVPHEPHPPDGSPESIRIFRAGRNYLRWRVLCWFAAQFGMTIVFLLFTLPPLLPKTKLTAAAREFWLGAVAVGVVVWAAVALFSLALQKLNYEQRWYIVTDRSLRIRAGIWDVRETTMTFANIQDIRVKRGPLQLVLGLADVEVASAGGTVTQHGMVPHRAVFSGVDEAEGLRDLLTERLRRYRDAGLGDPGDHAPAKAAPVAATAEAAAKELLAEARRLRGVLVP
jgi:membrane protein YdbS with pleckstrin-like domain